MLSNAPLTSVILALFSQLSSPGSRRERITPPFSWPNNESALPDLSSDTAGMRQHIVDNRTVVDNRSGGK